MWYSYAGRIEEAISQEILLPIKYKTTHKKIRWVHFELKPIYVIYTDNVIPFRVTELIIIMLSKNTLF